MDECFGRRLGLRGAGANAGRVPLIHQSDRKNDRLDARHLAKLARVDPSLLCPITHRDGTTQAHLSVIRARDVLVRARTALINCVRGLVKPTGLQLPSCAIAYFARKVVGSIPHALLAAITPLLDRLQSLSDAICRMARRWSALLEQSGPRPNNWSK
jgi:transposase